MREAILEGKRRFVVRDVPDPALDEGEVLIKVRYCGICSSDLHTYIEGVNIRHGHEFAGDIVEVGAGVKQLSLGLTRDRKLAGARYMDDPKLLGAYLLFYWPVSYAQAREALGELPAAPYVLAQVREYARALRFPSPERVAAAYVKEVMENRPRGQKGLLGRLRNSAAIDVLPRRRVS